VQTHVRACTHGHAPATAEAEYYMTVSVSYVFISCAFRSLRTLKVQSVGPVKLLWPVFSMAFLSCGPLAGLSLDLSL
jgi:hypothetical protein